MVHARGGIKEIYSILEGKKVQHITKKFVSNFVKIKDISSNTSGPQYAFQA